MIVRSRPPEANGRTRLSASGRVDTLQRIEEGWCRLRNSQRLPLQSHSLAAKFWYTYSMSDDGYGGGGGGGGGDDYDYGGPRSVPFFHPLESRIADSSPSFNEGAFVRVIVLENSHRTHNAARMIVMIS